VFLEPDFSRIFGQILKIRVYCPFKVNIIWQKFILALNMNLWSVQKTSRFNYFMRKVYTLIIVLSVIQQLAGVW